MKKQLLFALALTMTAMASAKDIQVKTFRYAGPFDVPRPVLLDSVDAQQRPFTPSSLLDTPLHLDLAQDGQLFSGALTPTSPAPCAMHLLQFSVQNGAYRRVSFSVRGLKHFQVYVDGKRLPSPHIALAPQTHRVVIKYLSQNGQTDSLKIGILGADESFRVSTDKRRLLTLTDILDGRKCTQTSLSANGRYLIATYHEVAAGGSSRTLWRLSDPKTGHLLRESTEPMAWIPNTNRYCITQRMPNGRDLITADLHTGREETLARGIPDGAVTPSPQADYLVLATSQEGPKEDRDLYEILSPEDRQPNWRKRSGLSLYNLQTGLCRPLTFGFHNVALQDISQDGRYLLLMTTRERLTQRPTTLYSLYRLDVRTMQSECLLHDEGFIASAVFSPDATRRLVKGAPEAFGGIGKNVPEGRIPNMFDYQLFLVDIGTKAVRALTRDFDPSIEDFSWNAFDQHIYFTALDKDCRSLFRLDPKSLRFHRFDVPEDYVSQVSFARNAPVAAWVGESVSNSDRLYTLQLGNGRSTLIEDLSREKLQDIDLGRCQPWNFLSSRGDTIYGRCYLPPHFDATKKYPLVVNYYGGCSPVSRLFESRYPLHLYAAQGYVVYLINPSGAAGFGQEHSSRHVNTAGKGVADDIIEGTQAFLAAHPYVDAQRVGCIGASYGGFMTQYLQTQTRLFAAAVSHAGISDHTSYWGEGYWGYSYSEVSMANSYPWTRKDLYVDQSPLFNAEKIHTPLLFLHGNADTNVPIGESIQMFTALKLLGRPTALVVVNGENHTITHYQKRIKWQDTIFAWLARYLQGDGSWWNALYPEKQL